MGISESFATALLAADKAHANHTESVTPEAVAETLVNGLQAAVSKCTSKEATTLQPRSADWYK